MSGGGGKIEVILNDTLISEIDDSTLLRKTEAASDYLTKSDASSTYLTTSDASKTYLAKSSIDGELDTDEKVLTTDDIGTYIIDTLTASDLVATVRHLRMVTFPVIALISPIAGVTYRQYDEQGFAYDTSSNERFTSVKVGDCKLNWTNLRFKNTAIIPRYVISGNSRIYEVTTVEGATTSSEFGDAVNIDLNLNQSDCELRMPFIKLIRYCYVNFQSTRCDVDFGDASRESVFIRMNISTDNVNSFSCGPRFRSGLDFAPGSHNNELTITIRKTGQESLLNPANWPPESFRAYYANHGNPNKNLYLTIKMDACLAEIEANRKVMGDVFNTTWENCISAGNIVLI